MVWVNPSSYAGEIGTARKKLLKNVTFTLVLLCTENDPAPRRLHVHHASRNPNRYIGMPIIVLWVHTTFLRIGISGIYRAGELARVPRAERSYLTLRFTSLFKQGRVQP